MEAEDSEVTPSYRQCYQTETQDDLNQGTSMSAMSGEDSEAAMDNLWEKTVRCT